MFLLDTVVLSELRKSQPSRFVLTWLGKQTQNRLFVSVVSLGEIERGAEKQRAVNPEFSTALFRWLEVLQSNFADRILPVTPVIARKWGALSAQLNRDDVDLLIAATAMTHDLTVATRNIKHFSPTGVKVIDPFVVPPRDSKG